MKLKTVFFIIICLVVNCLAVVSGTALHSFMPKTVPLLAGVPDAMRLAAAVRLPVAALNAVVEEETPVAAQLRALPEDTASAARHRTSFWMPSNGGASVSRLLRVTAQYMSGAPALSGVNATVGRCITDRAPPGGTGGFLCLAMLMYFVVLSRSSLPWENYARLYS